MRPPEFVGVSVTMPPTVGVIVNVCNALLLLKVLTIGVLRPPPEGVMVIVPVYLLPVGVGVTVKLAEAVFTEPEVGPLKVNDVTAACAFGAIATEDPKASAIIAAADAIRCEENIVTRLLLNKSIKFSLAKFNFRSCEKFKLFIESSSLLLFPSQSL